MDVDGICGGYNLQWAWATGILAGSDAGRSAVLKVNQIKLPLNHSKKQLKEAIVHKLRIRPEEMIDYRILKQSIDARKSGKGGHAGEVLYQYSVAVTLAN